MGLTISISFIPFIHLDSSRYPYPSISYVDEYHIVKLLNAPESSKNKQGCIIKDKYEINKRLHSTNSKRQRAGALSPNMRTDHKTLERFNLMRAAKGKLLNEGNGQCLYKS
jgi:hypothetical protein